MSILKDFPLTIDSTNAGTYLSAESGITLGGSHCLATASTGEKKATINANGMANLFPNGIAHPIKCDARMRIAKEGSLLSATASCYIYIDGTLLLEGSNTSTDYVNKTTTGNTSSAVLNATKTSSLQFGLKTSRSSVDAYANICEFIFYFMRYDFSATAGEGTWGVTVTKENGYDGDLVTFAALVDGGYEFDGWYDGDTKVSSDQFASIFVNGSDLHLTAKAIRSTGVKTVTTKYGDTTIATEELTPPVVVSYNGATIVSIESGQEKTLNCSGKIMASNVVIGSKILNCNGKYMSDDIKITVS